MLSRQFPPRKNVEKRVLLENMEGLFLAVDEIVDGGWVPPRPPRGVSPTRVPPRPLRGVPPPPWVRCEAGHWVLTCLCTPPAAWSWRATPSKWCIAWPCG